MPDTMPPSTAAPAALSAEILRQAVLSCPHTIEASQVVLEFDATQPGHNALNQLGRRLGAAVAAATPGHVDAKQGDSASERAVTDFLLTRLGLGPESCRGEDGGIDLRRVQGLLAQQSAQREPGPCGQALTNTKGIPS